MSDPAIEAALRAWEYAHPTHREDRWTVMKAASREALAPLRELHTAAPWLERGLATKDSRDCRECRTEWPCDTAKLIYPSEEL